MICHEERKGVIMRKFALPAWALAVLIAFSCFPLSGASAEGMPYVTSDTVGSISCVRNGTYQFKFTVHGTHKKPAITVGNKRVLQTVKLTSSRDPRGNDVYYFKVKVIGETGTGVYTTLPGQYPDLQCVVDVVEKSIPYRNLYAGFVDNEHNALPLGDVLIQSEGDWHSFQKKYLQMSPDFAYRNIPDVDFAKDAVLYHMEYTAGKEDVYLYARPVNKVVLVNGKPVLEEGDFTDNFEISTAAHDGTHYVILVEVKKSDLK